MIKNKRISLLIPCLNEQEGIGSLLQRVPRIVDEMIVVDNGSTDATARIGMDLGAKVVFEPQKGYGQAYLTGFKHCSGDIIATMDGDDSYPLEALPELVEKLLQKELDFISGTRFPLRNPEAMSLVNIVGNRLLTFFFRSLTGRDIRDSYSGMWVFKREILSLMELESKGMPLAQEIKMEAILNRNINFDEHPIDYRPRLGKAKLRRWRDGMQTLLFLPKKRLKIALRKDEFKKSN